MSAESSVGPYWDEWARIAEMLETRQMPPKDEADLFPTDDERAAAAEWVRATLAAYEAAHAGDHVFQSPRLRDGAVSGRWRVPLRFTIRVREEEWRLAEGGMALGAEAGVTA